MKQNIYDHPDFFAGYQALRDRDVGINGALEVPALRRVLPDLSGKAVLDLGCGLGHFTGFALSQGASSYVGIDISKRMLAVAKSRFSQPEVTFVNESVEDYSIEAGAFDVVVSSLCFHYVSDYMGLLAKVSNGLRQKGTLAFSVEHPICTALLRDWHLAKDGTKDHWPVDRYNEEGIRTSRWFVDGVVKYHRTIETYVNGLIKVGLTVSSLQEPVVETGALSRRPDLKDDNRRPPFLIIAATKPPT